MASQEREYPSLLFTPQPQQKQGDGARARSPRSTRSPSTPAYNRTSLYREGSGSRRRSLTPTGSIRDTPPPPPPPSMSYLNADGGESSKPDLVRLKWRLLLNFLNPEHQNANPLDHPSYLGDSATSKSSIACRRTSESNTIRTSRYHLYPNTSSSPVKMLLCRSPENKNLLP